MSRQTRYSEERVAEILAVANANNGNLTRTALDTGVPRKTIEYWDRNAKLDGEIRRQKQVELGDMCEGLARRWWDVAVQNEESGEFADFVRAAAIATDKMLLLRGQATQITRKLDPESMRQELIELLKSGSIDAEVIHDTHARDETLLDEPETPETKLKDGDGG